MKVLLSIAAVLAGATTLAATAHADPNDAEFLQKIRDGMKKGTPYKTVVSTLFQGNGNLGPDGAAYFVSASAQAYCPELVAE